MKRTYPISQDLNCFELRDYIWARTPEGHEARVANVAFQFRYEHPTSYGAWFIGTVFKNGDYSRWAYEGLMGHRTGGGIFTSTLLHYAPTTFTVRPIVGAAERALAEYLEHYGY